MNNVFKVLFETYWNKEWIYEDYLELEFDEILRLLRKANISLTKSKRKKLKEIFNDCDHILDVLFQILDLDITEDNSKNGIDKLIKHLYKSKSYLLLKINDKKISFEELSK